MNLRKSIKPHSALAEYPWTSTEHIPLNKLQDDPIAPICRYFHGDMICRRSRSQSESQVQTTST